MAEHPTLQFYLGTLTTAGHFIFLLAFVLQLQRRTALGGACLEGSVEPVALLQLEHLQPGLGKLGPQCIELDLHGLQLFLTRDSIANGRDQTGDANGQNDPGSDFVHGSEKYAGKRDEGHRAENDQKRAHTDETDHLGDPYRCVLLLLRSPVRKIFHGGILAQIKSPGPDRA